VRLIPAENKRTQLCLQTELDEEKSQSLHSQKLLHCGEHNKSTSRKKTNVALNAIKAVLYAGPKLARHILTNLSPSLARRITLHHVKIFILRVLLP